MKKALAFLLFLLFLLLVWLAWGWYKDTVACCEEPVAEVQYGPLIFDCATDGVITNDLWPDKKQEIMAARIAGKKLLLVGPYFGDEDRSMGMARAEKVKALFPEIPGCTWKQEQRQVFPPLFMVKPLLCCFLTLF